MANPTNHNTTKDIEVSFLITYYNQKNCIAESLGSAIRQNLNVSKEILCIDDGSSDGTFEELKLWEKEYPDIIKIFQTERDDSVRYEPIIRVSNNRWFLYKIAKGKYISFLDGDDYYSDDYKTQLQYDLLEKYPQCSCCGSAFDYVWPERNARNTHAMLDSKCLMIDTNVYWATTWLHADTFLYRKFDLENPFYNIFDDNLITCYFLNRGKVLFLPKSTVDYVQIEGSSWNDRSEVQRAVVNIAAFELAEKILNRMKYENWLRNYSAFRTFFKSRHEAIEIPETFSFIANNEFVARTLKYHNERLLNKLLYLLRYGLIYGSDLGVRVIKKAYRFSLRRFKIKGW